MLRICVMTLLQEVGSECVREGLTTNQCLNLVLKAAIEIVGA